LKAAGQLAGSLSFLAIMWGPDLWRSIAQLHLSRWLPGQPGLRLGLEILAGVAIAAAAAMGIRTLSADCLIRVSGMTRGGASAGSRVRNSRIDALVRRFFGGQTAVAGSAFVSRMMLRDFQFRRQIMPMLLFTVVGFAFSVGPAWPADPLSGGAFSKMHLLPHVLGSVLFFICIVLPYGNDYKGVWIFLNIPSRALGGFARGVFALLWFDFVLLPNLIALPLLAWRWGSAMPDSSSLTAWPRHPFISLSKCV
jgi:hypothetical protein